MSRSATLARLDDATKHLEAPLAVADLDAFDRNAADLVRRAGGKPIRIASKSLRSRFLLLLTATPIETELEELYQLVTLLKPGQFATPAAFRRRFVDPASPTSPKNRGALRELLGEVMVRNTRASCGLKLPPRYVSTVGQ